MSMRGLFTSGVLLFLCRGIAGQTPAARPEFEVVGIKLNVSGSDAMGFDLPPSGLFSSTNTPMSTLFRFAYDVSDQTMAGAPDWFRDNRYDIVAKAPARTPYPTLRLLLQSLFAKQLKLTVHTEPRAVSAYALTVAKAPARLQSADGTEKTGCTPVGEQGPSAGGRHMQCSMTMQELAHALPSLAPAYISKPVVDQTGLAGTYGFKLDWVGNADIDAVGGLTMFGAVEKLGLKLVSGKIPVPVVVIDHVEKPPLN
jgi:uncharacterized protein (TIGR03435 family)